MSTATAAAVRERPILMSGPMVRAILEGKKTQTRRVVKPQPQRTAVVSDHDDGNGFLVENWPKQDRMFDNFGRAERIRCPYGVPGDRLWVRETHLRMKTETGSGSGDPSLDEVMYEDHPDYDICWPTKEDAADAIDLGWRIVRSIHMPRWASRLTLELTDVRVERVQDISEDDAIAEGVEFKRIRVPTLQARALGSDVPWMHQESYREGFREAWESLNAKRGFGWDVNPWVWALTFREFPAGAA